MSNKVYEIITNEIIKKLEDGVIPWERPWDGMYTPKNFASGKEYRGINTILLGMQMYDSPFWATFKQIQNNYGRIKKGEKSTIVVFWKWLEVKDDDSDNPEATKEIPFLRYYRVFNLEQTEGIPWEKCMQFEERKFNPIDTCTNIVICFKDKPEIKLGGGRAYYSPIEDKLQIPIQSDFKSSEGYYSTLFHELVHSTGHVSRLNRKSIVDHNPFGSKEYSKEELIAEIGAAFLCSFTGIKNETIDNSASYIQSWLRVLKEDCKMIVIAAGQAQKAVDYICKDEYEPELIHF